MANAREPELLAPHLSQIRCPVRLMVGGAHHDGDVGVAEVQLLARTLPAFVIDSVPAAGHFIQERSEEHTSELQSQSNLVCRLLLEKKKYKPTTRTSMSGVACPAEAVRRNFPSLTES